MRSEQYDILLIDDDAEDRLILGEAFAEAGCGNRVTMFESGLHFFSELAQVKKLSPLPLLVVLDYNMPGANGLDVLQVLKNDDVLFQIPVVMYSTGMSRKLQEECMNKGGENFVEKGSTYQDVLLFVKQLCRQTFVEKRPF